MTERSRWEAIGDRAIAFLFYAAFPRLAFWPSRLGLRGRIAYVAFTTTVGFALRAWAIPHLRRMAEEQERARQQLRQELEREPTEDELLAHIGIACGR